MWIIKPFLPEWGVVPPKSCLGGCGTIEGMIPFVQWVNNLIDILRNYEIFGFFTFREFTRSIANLIDIPLDFTEALLYKGFNTIPLGPMPWVMILGLVIILGLYLRGVNLAILGGACVLYLAIFSLRGIWTLSMKTLAAIAVSVPLAVIIGILLGILGAKFKIAERALKMTRSKGLNDYEIFFDPLALPISTGIEEDRLNAKETIISIKSIFFIIIID